MTTSAPRTERPLQRGQDPVGASVRCGRVTPNSLSRRARELSRNVDATLWQRAELAYRAREAHIPGWAEIIGVEFRRAPSTVMAWAATWAWMGDHALVNRSFVLPYSFYERASQAAHKLGDDRVIDLMATFAADPGATLEQFRAQLWALGAEAGGDFEGFVAKERARLLGWVDRAPTQHAGECLALAADALADALADESEAA